MRLPNAKLGFENLIPAAKTALTRLRRILVTSTVASASWLNLSGAALAGVPIANGATPAPNPPTTLFIKDRAKKAAKLVLRLADARGDVAVQHRSHSSHRSHASHYSSRSAPSESRPRSSPTPPPAVESLDQQVVVTLVKVDVGARTFTGRDELELPFEFVFRSSIKVFAADSFQTRNGDGLAPLIGHKVRVTWQYSDDGKKKRLATKVTPVS